MQIDTRIKLAVYEHFATTGEAPAIEAVSARTHASPADVRSSYARLSDLRVLVLTHGGASIRMAPPFSGTPTQHVVTSGGVRYYANCAWDALGIPAALARPAVVRSRCAESGDPLVLEVSSKGVPPSDWLFHCLVPAASWWDDIGFT